MINLQSKNTLFQRCPWCGSEDGRGANFRWNPFIRIDNSNWDRCKNCGNYYKTKNTWHYSFSTALGILSLFCGIYNVKIMILFLIISIILFSISASNSPYIRVSTGKWDKRVYPYPKPTSIRARFYWLSLKEGGAFLMNYRVQEDIILPICFINEDNQPISQTWCVVLENIKRKGNNQIVAEIHLLLEEAPELLLQTGNHFIVFGHNSKIGYGEIIKKYQNKSGSANLFRSFHTK